MSHNFFIGSKLKNPFMGIWSFFIGLFNEVLTLTLGFLSLEKNDHIKILVSETSGL